MSKDTNFEKWYEAQLALLINGQEIEPPWIIFPDSSPIHGWNQGITEYWKNNIWLPFWQRMTQDEKENYFARWRPSEEWREALMVYWI